jgi:peptide deformylase
MAVLEILTAPHPVLSAKARPVRADEFGPAIKTFLSDMAETMYAAPGVGLAAPQVGDGRRMIVADLTDDGKADNPGRGKNVYHMVNPEIVEKSREIITYEESCLSVPEYYVDVQRARRIRVRWQDAEGRTSEQWFEEFPAVVLQHELDHLEGVTLLDRSSRLKRSRYLARKKKAQGRGAEAAL